MLKSPKQKRKHVGKKTKASSGEDSSSEDADTSEKKSDGESLSDSDSHSETKSGADSTKEDLKADHGTGKEDKSKKREKKSQKEEKDKKEAKPGKYVKRVKEDKEEDVRVVVSPATTPTVNANAGVDSSAPPLAPVIVLTVNLAESFNYDWDHMFFFPSLHKTMIKLPADLNMQLRTKISGDVSLFSAKYLSHTHAPSRDSPKSTEKKNYGKTFLKTNHMIPNNNDINTCLFTII